LISTPPFSGRCGSLSWASALISKLPPQQGQAKPKSRRTVFLGSSGRQEVPVYDGTVLGTGALIDGPALIEQPTTTLLLLAMQQARTDDHGNFLVEQR